MSLGRWEDLGNVGSVEKSWEKLAKLGKEIIYRVEKEGSNEL